MTNDVAPAGVPSRPQVICCRCAQDFGPDVGYGGSIATAHGCAGTIERGCVTVGYGSTRFDGDVLTWFGTPPDGVAEGGVLCDDCLDALVQDGALLAYNGDHGLVALSQPERRRLRELTVRRCIDQLFSGTLTTIPFALSLLEPCPVREVAEGEALTLALAALGQVEGEALEMALGNELDRLDLRDLEEAARRETFRTQLMSLGDAVDAAFDRKDRPDGPTPTGNAFHD